MMPDRVFALRALALYLPIARFTESAARLVGRIQQGRIAVYLTYSFVTLLVLLFFVG